MKLVVLPKPSGLPLPYYLSVEEWVAKRLPPSDYLFAWQTAPSIICGRHQLMQLEVDVDYCNSAKIEIWRRKSGGGCVYSDMNNLMFSYVTNRQGNQGSFKLYTDAMCRMLASLCINALSSGRNVIEIDGRKLAWYAFNGLKNRSIVHGTMLYDIDFDTMNHALTPSRAKLSAKGVKSEPKRDTSLREQGLTMTVSEFKDIALSLICDEGSVALPDSSESEIQEIMQSYLNAKFRYDKVAKSEASVRIEGCGEISFVATLTSENCISNPSISGDFFPNGDIQMLLDRISSAEFSRQGLEQALAGVEVSAIISGLSAENLINIILQSKL